MKTELLATFFQEGGRLISGLLQTYGIKRRNLASRQLDTKEPEQKREGLTTEDTLNYQRREIVKELSLLEGHLQQGCKIDSKACDCCERHPMKIEGLAQETVSMSPDPVFRELAEWTKSIALITTEDAAASGKYDDQYPKLAIKAREFRKAIMPAGFKRKLSEKEVESGHQVPATGEEH